MLNILFICMSIFIGGISIDRGLQVSFRCLYWLFKNTESFRAVRSFTACNSFKTGLTRVKFALY